MLYPLAVVRELDWQCSRGGGFEVYSGAVSGLGAIVVLRNAYTWISSPGYTLLDVCRASKSLRGN